MQYATLADVYSAVRQGPGEDVRKGIKKALRTKAAAVASVKNGLQQQRKQFAREVQAVVPPPPPPPPTPAGASEADAPPKLNLHTDNNAAASHTTPEEEDFYNRSIMVDVDPADVGDEEDAVVAYGRSSGRSRGEEDEHDSSYEPPQPSGHAAAGDGVMDLMMYILAGVLFILLVDQVFEMGVAVGKAASAARV